jgi:hypothetical protein
VKKAYRTKFMGCTSIVAAEKRSQARYLTFKAAEEAGWRVKLTEPMTIRRAPEFDGWAEVDETRRCYSECYLPKVQQHEATR